MECFSRYSGRRTIHNPYIHDRNEKCADSDTDGLCDVCGGEMICLHASTTTGYSANADGTHKILAVCSCGVTAQTGTEDCVDNNSNGNCDKCSAKIPCKHSETEPAYEAGEDGTHTVSHVCSSCGETISTATEDCTDENSDNACDHCGNDLIPEIEVVKFNISSIPNLDTQLELSMLFPQANIRADLDYTATVKQISGGEVVNTFTFAEEEWIARTVSKKDYWAVKVTMAAKCMADSFVLEVTDQYGNVWNEPYTMSYRKYAETMLGRSSTAASMKTLLVDMLNYGAAAQNKFTYNTGDLANNTIDAYQELSLGDVEHELKFVKAKNYLGVTASLESQILLNMFFKITDVTGMYATVEYTDYLGNEVSYRVESAQFVARTGGYGVSVATVPADVSTAITITLYYADGTQFDTMTESVGSYLTRASSVLSGDPTFAKVGIFGQAAYNHFKK